MHSANARPAHSTQVQFGREAQCTLSRTGDLVTYMYCVIELPGIVACDSGEMHCGGLGENAFRTVDFFPNSLSI